MNRLRKYARTVFCMALSITLLTTETGLAVYAAESADVEEANQSEEKITESESNLWEETQSGGTDGEGSSAEQPDGTDEPLTEWKGEPDSTEESLMEEESSVEASGSVEESAAEITSSEQESTVEMQTETVSIEESQTEPMLSEEIQTEPDTVEEIQTEQENETETESEECVQRLAFSDTDIAHGEYKENGNDITWVIDQDGKLTVEGTGDFADSISGDGTRAPWYSNRESVKAAIVSVKGMKDASYMFRGCSNLESLDLSNFDTRSVTDMYFLFMDCRSLKSLDLSNFDTGSVTNMSGMFGYCSNLKSLDLSNFDTGNVTNMRSMFSSCRNLESLDLSNFDTGSVTDMNGMFSMCYGLKSVNLNNFDTGSVTDMNSLFYDCRSLESLDLSNFDTGSVTGMGGMFYSCNYLKSLDLSNFDTSNVKSMSNMFYACYRLENVNLSNFDTGSVTDMNSMFDACKSLKSLDLSSFNTGSVTNMFGMFDACGSLESLDLSNFDTSSVKTMHIMFHGCKSLESLDLSNFDTGSVTDMNGMFGECDSLKSLNLSSFDTSSVTDMEYMLLRCKNLSSVYTPYNLKCSVSLPNLSSDDTATVWYKTDGTTITEFPKNLSYSIFIMRDKVPELDLAHITAKKGKTVYAVGEQLEIDDITVTYYGSDGTVRKLTTGFGTNAAAIDMSKPGEKTLTITYEGLTAEITLSVAIVMTEDTVTITLSAENYVYDGEAKMPVPAVTLTGNGTALENGKDFKVSYKNNINAGTNAVVIVTGQGDYRGTITRYFTIKKAPAPAAESLEANAAQCTTAQQGRTVDLTGCFADYKPVTSYVVKECREDDTISGGVLADTPSVKNGVLTYNTDAGTAGDFAVVTIEVAFANYENSILTVTIKMTAAQTVTISGISISDSVYDGTAAVYSGTAAVALEDGTDVTGEIAQLAYHYSGTQADGTGYDSNEAPVNAGTYTLTVAVPAENEAYAGSEMYPFRITPAPVSVSAVDVTLAIGEALPSSYDYEVTGLVNGDRLVAEPTLSCSVADTAAAGTYEIVISGADAGANYEITHHNGTLAIVEQKGLYIEISDSSYIFTGNAVKPSVLVYVEKGGTLLKAGKDYTVTYKNNINADSKAAAGGTGSAENDTAGGFDRELPYIIITGKGNYQKSIYTNFHINPASISDDGETPAAGFTLKYTEQFVTANKAQKPFTSIKYKKAMTMGKDYEVSLAKCMEDGSLQNIPASGAAAPVIAENDTGTFQLTITGKGNYSGTITKEVYVGSKSSLMKNAKIALGRNIKSVKYTGSDIEPKAAAETGEDVFTVKMGSQYLTPGVDYNVSYSNQKAVGTATIIVKGTGEYIGTKTATFKITGTPFKAKDATVNGFEASKTYTGSAIEQGGDGIVIGGKTLVCGTDYTTACKNNVKKGTATVTFRANPASGYSGSFNKTFKITAVDLSQISGISFDEYTVTGAGADRKLSGSVVYSKAGAKPSGSFTLKDANNNTLALGTDYTVSYTNNKKVGAPAVMTIKGKGNYTGKMTVGYTIGKAPLDGNDNLTQSCTPAAYNQNKPNDYLYKPKFKVLDGNKALAARTDYKALTNDSYKNCTQDKVEAYLAALENGTVTGEALREMQPQVEITAADNGGYTGSIKVYLTVYKTKLAKNNLKVAITPDTDIYTGKQVRPEVTVTVTADGKTKLLAEGRDYTLTYGTNITAGKNKGTVTVNGTGLYGGSVTTKFTIQSKDVNKR